MRNGIYLMNYHFTFSKTSEEGRDVVKFYYYDTTEPDRVQHLIKSEDIKRTVLPYKPAFNAEYAMEDMPEELFDDLRATGCKQLLYDWLKEQYATLQFMEIMEGDSTDEKKM